MLPRPGLSFASRSITQMSIKSLRSIR